MKRTLYLTASLIAAMPVAADAQGIAVYDQTSTLQLIAQVKNTLQQIQQGEQMISQAATTYQSLSKLTDTANFANVLNNPLVNQILPSGITDVVQLAKADYGALGTLGQGASSVSSHFTIQTNLGGSGTLSSSAAAAYNQYLQSINQGPSVAAALGNSLTDQTRQIDSGLDELRTDISSAKDPKDTLDLSARAAIENAKINNRILQLMAIQQYYGSTERLRYNTYRLNNSASRTAAIDAKLQADAQQYSGF